MSAILLGYDARGRPLKLTTEQRRSTHMHVIGGSRTGKSKFLEWMIRRDIREGNGLCLIDWHGTLYNDVIQHCAYLDVGLEGDSRSVVLLSPSRPDFVTGFNPFVAGDGDVSVQVSRRVDATIRPWGVTNTDQTPTFNRICRLLYTFMIENGQTLPNVAHLLHFKNRDLRARAALSLKDTFARAEWDEMQETTKIQDWKTEVLSTKNRLTRFVGSQSVRRFMGLPHGNLNLLEAMEQGKIILVNLGSSDYLDREAGRVFASLLLNECFEIAMRRAALAPSGQKPKLFNLYLDEFQEYITDDIASMLDEVLKGGLHMVLAHQHVGHFTDNPRLLNSVITNARLRAVFGGLGYNDACLFANEMFLPDLNSRQIKKAYYHTTHLYEEQTRTVRGHSHTSGRASTQAVGSSTGMSGSAEGWFGAEDWLNRFESESSSSAEVENESDSDSEVEVPIFVPIPVQELGSETEWNREEKVSKVAELLKCQQRRHCFIKLDTENTQPLKVPFVKEFRAAQGSLAKYQRELYARQGALPAEQADRLIGESERAFLLNLGQVTSQEGAVRDAPDDDADLYGSSLPKV